MMEIDGKIAEMGRGFEAHQVHPERFFANCLRKFLSETQKDNLILLCAGHVGENLQGITDIGKLVDALEKNGQNFMELMVSISKTDFGNEVLDSTGYTFERLIQKVSLEIRRGKLQKEISLSPKDNNFVGRMDERMEILCFLRSQRQSITGVYIWGEAGMGKTALAEEVCYQSKFETIHVYNLRGKKSIRDLLLSIFYTLCHFKSIKLSGDQREKEELKFTENFAQPLDILEDLIEENLLSLKTDTVLLLDNVDDIEQWAGQEFVSFLQRLFDIKTDKVKFVMTNRKLPADLDIDPESLLSKELKALTDDEARQMLMKSTKEPEYMRLSDLQMNSLIQKCQHSPLLIKTVMKTVQSLSEGELKSPLEAVFDSLSKTSPLPQKRLIELSIFEAVFDKEMAKSVMKEDHLGLSKLAEQNLLEKHETKSSSEIPTDITYSFHPLVLHCLKKVCANCPDRQYISLRDNARNYFFEFFFGYIGSLKLETNYRYDAYAHMINFKACYDYFFQFLQEKGYEFPKSNTKKTASLETLLKALSFSSNIEEQKIFLKEMDLSLENRGTQEGTLEECLIKVSRVILFSQENDHEAAKILMKKLENRSVQIEQLQQKDFRSKNFVLGRIYYAKGLITMDEAGQHHNAVQCSDKQQKCLEDALTWFRNSLMYLEARGHSKRIQETIEVEIAKVHNVTGSVLFRMEDYERSQYHHDQAYKCLCKHMEKNYMAKEMHKDIPVYLYNMGSALWKMAAEFRRRKQKDEALKYFTKAAEHTQRALNITKKLGTPANKTTVLWLLRMADIHRQLARCTEDLESNRKAADHCKRTMVRYTEELESYRKASNHCKRALGILRRKSHILDELLVDALHTMGFIQYSKGNYLCRSADSSLTGDARQAFEKSARYYKSLMSVIAKGKSCSEIDVLRIKAVHIKALEILEDQDLNKTQQFYKDFEEGKQVCNTGTEIKDYYSDISDEEEEPSQTAPGPEKQDSGFEDSEVTARRRTLQKQDSFNERIDDPLRESQTSLISVQSGSPSHGSLMVKAVPGKRARLQKQSSFSAEDEELDVTEDDSHQKTGAQSFDDGDAESLGFSESNPERKRLDSALGDSISESFD